MWAAVWDQNLRIAELLLSHGAEVNPVVHNEMPLLLVVKSKRLKLLDWLVKNGADLNFRDAKGYAALHHAIKRKYTAAQVKML